VAIREILLLGNPALYRVSEPVDRDELPALNQVVEDLRDTLLEFQRRHGRGRAIAAPQIGVTKRLVYWHAAQPQVIINPTLEKLSVEMMELWDDCMSFPDLLVRVRRHRRCAVRFRDLHWTEITWTLEDDLSELIQHEYDHLDGILATQRAVNLLSLALRSELART
jgi:peptide deformylase